MKYGVGIDVSKGKSTVAILSINGEVIEMPFDINQDRIEILDHDFGIFCMDVMDHPRKYEGKTIKIKGK